MIVTSVQLPSESGSGQTDSATMSVFGSTIRSDGSPRVFQIDIPALNCNFNGTGDMFAALTVARLRQVAAADPSLYKAPSWVSPDEVPATDLPLAKVAERVLSSMHFVLQRTLEARNAELAVPPTYDEDYPAPATEEERQKREHLRRTKASEVRLIRNVHLLRNPEIIFRAKELK